MMWNFVQALLLALSLQSCFAFTQISIGLSKTNEGDMRVSFPVMASIESVELSDRFDRWRFLQRLLDLEVDNEAANELVLRVLDNSLKRKKSDDAMDNTAEITNALRAKMSHAISGSLETLNTVDMLDTLLPDMAEDEDAFKSLWDTVTEIHGREMTKMDEAEGTPEWKLACIQARVLIHFDFLSLGI